MRNRPRTARPDAAKSRPYPRKRKARSGTFLVAPAATESVASEADAQGRTRGQSQTGPAERAFAASRLRSLERFKDDAIATLVHELKSPLAAMMMNLDFALSELSVHGGGETRDARSALAESRVAGAKLFRAIANLLDVARSDDGRLVPKRAPVDLDALVFRVLEPYVTEAKALSVTLRSEVTLLRPIEVDPDLLARALSNLVESALRHASAGGSVVLAARPGHGLAAVLSVTGEGSVVEADPRVAFFDKGAPRGEAAEPDARSRGLYFCRVAIEAHGGSLELVSDPALATFFRIELPA